MDCDHCRREAILFQPYSGQHLCERHFTLDVERRAKRIIRKNGWIARGDRIAVAAKGDARGRALLHFLVSAFGARKDLSFFVVSIDEEEHDHRDLTEILQRYGLEQIRGSIGDAAPSSTQGTSGSRYDERIYREQRMRCVQQIAQENHATRIALGSTLDDEAYDMLTDVLLGDISRLSSTENGLPCIRPFVYVPEREVIRYAHLHTRMQVSGNSPQHHRNHDVLAALEDYSSRHPSTPFALAHLREIIVLSMERSRRYGNGPGENIFPQTEVPGKQREGRHAV
jgi:tRNA(Ile)-lysidine synthase TilS/MesJ